MAFITQFVGSIVGGRLKYINAGLWVIAILAGLIAYKHIGGLNEALNQKTLVIASKDIELKKKEAEINTAKELAKELKEVNLKKEAEIELLQKNSDEVKSQLKAALEREEEWTKKRLPLGILEVFKRMEEKRNAEVK